MISTIVWTVPTDSGKLMLGNDQELTEEVDAIIYRHKSRFLSVDDNLRALVALLLSEIRDLKEQRANLLEELLTLRGDIE